MSVQDDVDRLSRTLAGMSMSMSAMSARLVKAETAVKTLTDRIKVLEAEPARKPNPFSKAFSRDHGAG